MEMMEAKSGSDTGAVMALTDQAAAEESSTTWRELPEHLLEVRPQTVSDTPSRRQEQYQGA